MTEFNIDKLKVIDNYIPDLDVHEIKRKLLDMEWLFTNSPYGDFNTSRMFGINLFKNDTFHSKIPTNIKYLIDLLSNDIFDGGVELVRCLANMQAMSQFSEVHTDTNTEDCISVIYHVNESEGDTCFYDDRYGKPVHNVPFKQGRLVIFPSHFWHEGLPPTKYMSPNNNFRVSLGFVFRMA